MGKGRKMPKSRGGNPSGKLTARQKAFVAEYMIDLNASQACIRAGYSAKTAGAAASRLLKDVRVSQALAIAKGERNDRLQLDADEVLRELLAIAKSDIRQVFNPDGTLKPIVDWPAEIAAFVSSIETEETSSYDPEADGPRVVGKVRKLKMWDKLRALELLGKHLGTFVERVDHTTKGDKIEATAGAQVMIFGDHKITFE